MKKIIAITAMVAAAAGIAMAAEVKAKTCISGNLFGYDKDGDKISILDIDHNAENWNPNMAFSFSNEKAGASFKLYDGYYEDLGLQNIDYWRMSNSFGEVAIAYNIWLQPISMLKINLGAWDTNLNQEQIDWSNTDSGIGSVGYTLSLYPVSGVSADLTFAPGWKDAWFSKVGDQDANIAELGFKFQYGADFGTVNAIFDAKDSFDTLKFGAGYSGNFGPVFAFANVLGYYGKNYDENGENVGTKIKQFEKIRVEAFAKYGADALTVMAWVPVNVNVYKKASDTIELGATLKAQYSLGAITPYIYIKDANFLADDFSMTIKPGFTTNLDGASIDVALEVTAQDKLKIGIPVSFSMEF